MQKIQQKLTIQFVLFVQIFYGSQSLVDRINASNHIVKFVQINGFKIKQEMLSYKNHFIPNHQLLLLILDLDHNTVLNLVLFLKCLNKFILKLQINKMFIYYTLPNCPKCKKPFKKTSIPIIHNLLDSIQLSCIYAECNTKPGYEQFQKHILQCPFRRINCSGCGLQQLQNELEQHENQCEQVNIECSKCYNKMSRKQFQLHSVDDCVQQQFNNKDNQITQLNKKIDELNQKNQYLEQKICKMLKGESFDINKFYIITLLCISSHSKQCLLRTTVSLFSIHQLQTQFNAFKFIIQIYYRQILIIFQQLVILIYWQPSDRGQINSSIIQYIKIKK